MKELLYWIVEWIAKIHSHILRLNDAYEYNFTDKELHFLVIGMMGMGFIFVVYPVFKWLAKHDHVMVIAWIYVLTLIIVITFAIEIGVLYLNDFNEQVLMKIIREKGLEFEELFACDTYVYLWSGHPLAGQSVISMEELDEYPCLSFDQGRNSSLYLAEEMKSTYDYKRLIKANDRATLLNFMIGLNAYTLCSGIICEELNGSDYMAIPLKETEKMRIGYVKRKGASISHIGQIYIEELKKYKEKIM